MQNLYHNKLCLHWAFP